jgi:hypothetical protein
MSNSPTRIRRVDKKELLVIDLAISTLPRSAARSPADIRNRPILRPFH